MGRWGDGEEKQDNSSSRQGDKERGQRQVTRRREQPEQRDRAEAGGSGHWASGTTTWKQEDKGRPARANCARCTVRSVSDQKERPPVCLDLRRPGITDGVGRGGVVSVMWRAGGWSAWSVLSRSCRRPASCRASRESCPRARLLTDTSSPDEDQSRYLEWSCRVSMYCLHPPHWFGQGLERNDRTVGELDKSAI